MFTRRSLSIALTIFLFGASLTAGQPAVAGNRLIAHEWGTFTSLVDNKGNQLNWRPLHQPSELPSFVYTKLNYGKSRVNGTVRMETPVIYFYTDSRMKVSVNINFPQGRITEWYPAGNNDGKNITWSDFTVMPGSAVKFLEEKSHSHYYPARATDAAPLLINNEQLRQYEKFLFYRGVGTFELPVRVKLSDNRLLIKNRGNDEIAQIILFEKRQDKIGYRFHDLRGGEITIDRIGLEQSVDSFHEELRALLMAQGLYEKEAVAMINTWRETWSEDGLRLFYVLPRSLTDALLPTLINPEPAEFTRVMIVRVEIMNP